MRMSQWFSVTLKEIPNDAEIISHQLMLRAGMIRKLSSGLYTWLPLGLRVLRKIEHIIREEMNQVHAIELLMPAVQPAELWHETGRWDTFGGQLLTMKDSNNHDYCFGPTHEEVITDFVRQTLTSYKQLPLNFYQIQTKFRDEIRPRYGVMRAREFVMKDAYSFHLTQDSLQTTYDTMLNTYNRILTRLGLRYRTVEADTGSIGGSASHEFQVLADSGEDILVYSDVGSYAANIEQATCLLPDPYKYTVKQQLPQLQLIDTSDQKIMSDPTQMVKTLLVVGQTHSLIALVLRGEDALNDIKAIKHPLVRSPLILADEKTVVSIIKAKLSSLGPVNLGIPIIVDHQALAMPTFICGANQDDKHFINAVWERDIQNIISWDLRVVKEGDPSPDGIGKLQFCRGIEVGHVFQLGDKYTQAMHANVLDHQGQLRPMLMGCYGLGVSRLVAATIEQYHDAKGIIWPTSIAPFLVVIIPINGRNTESVQHTAIDLYNKFCAKGIEVILDDRDERPGILFADNDLIGIPHRIIISQKSIDKNVLEYKVRNSEITELIALNDFKKLLSIIVRDKL